MLQFPIGFYYQAIAGGDWTPAELSDIRYWFDASDADSITDTSGAVTTWNDLSGNSHHLTADSGEEPLTDSYTQNSLNAIYFDGTELMDYDHGSGDRWDSDNYMAMFVVAKKDTTSTGTWRYALNLANQYNSDIQFISFDRYSEDAQRCKSNGSEHNFSTLNEIDEVCRIFACHDDRTNFFTGQDGTWATHAVGTATQSNMQFCEVGYNYPGLICEIVVYFSTTSDISDSDIDKIEGYLAHKWGIEGNLDAGHTYKSAPPTL